MQYVNMNSIRKLRVLMPNEPEMIIVIWVNLRTAIGDMQFDNMELPWNIEAKQTLMPLKTITIECDRGLTVGKN